MPTEQQSNRATEQTCSVVAVSAVFKHAAVWLAYYCNTDCKSFAPQPYLPTTLGMTACDVCRLTLAQVNPILQNVVEVHEGGQLNVKFTPEHYRYPYNTATLTVDPMKMGLGQGPLLDELLQLLQQQPGVNRLKWVQQMSGGNAESKGATKFEAWTGPTEVLIEGRGKYKTRRVDMLIGEHVPPATANLDYVSEHLVQTMTLSVAIYS